MIKVLSGLGALALSAVVLWCLFVVAPHDMSEQGILGYWFMSCVISGGIFVVLYHISQGE